MHEKVALKGAREEKTRGEEEQRQLFARARVDQQWQKESSSIGWTEKRERESAGRGFAQRERRLVLFHPRPAAKRCDAKLDFSNSASILARTIETPAQLPFSSVLSLSLVRRSLARARSDCFLGFCGYKVESTPAGIRVLSMFTVRPRNCYEERRKLCRRIS